MSKRRYFSIYLLKRGYDSSNSLKDDHGLDDSVDAENLPENAILYILDSIPRPPWWKDFFGISRDLFQVTKGALIFLPVNDRWFALSFGHVFHRLKDTCYEYDFGLRVTLNSVDPGRLKSTDTVDPGATRRQRTQIPVGSDLTFFDFDKDSTILKRLSGKVKEEFREFFKHATGSSNLRISLKVDSKNLPGVCTKLLSIYERRDYEEVFPDIRNIEPVRDPSLIVQLNQKLTSAFREKDSNLNLAVPGIINHEDNIYANFIGAGSGDSYEDVTLEHYFEYLINNDIDLEEITIEALKSHELELIDENGYTKNSFNILKCFLFDTTLSDGSTYHLCEGSWYKIDSNYIKRMRDFLDEYYEESKLPEYNHSSEGVYNASVPSVDTRYICLDKTNISPTGNYPVEPCDLYDVDNSLAVFTHVKVSTRSSQLSHLFNQGVNSIELIKAEGSSLVKLKNLIKSNLNSNKENEYLLPLNQKKHKVIYAVVSRKSKGNKSSNFPLFSQMSLMRSIKALNLMSVEAAFSFVDDQRVKGNLRKGSKKSNMKKGK